jgi:hypothetical protein
MVLGKCYLMDTRIHDFLHKESTFFGPRIGRRVSFGPCMNVLIFETSKAHGARSPSASFGRFSKSQGF